MRKVVTISDFGEIITGKTPPTTNKSYYGDYAIFIKPTDISEECKYTYITEEMYSEIAAEKYASSRIPKGAICVPCIGTVGTKLTKSHCSCFTNQSINSIVCNDRYDEEYVYYLMKLFLPNLKLYNLGTASGREYISKSNFENIEIEAEQDKPTQIKIGRVLSLYDEQIENYQRQICLLEESARLLYKEWFVNLHFDGCENYNLQNGIPKGWEVRTLGDFAPFQRGKTITKKEIREGRIPVVAGGLSPAYYCDKSNTREKVITISGSGANAGFTRMYFEHIWASDCSFVDIDTTNFIGFVYCYLKSSEAEISNLQKGAAQPHVYAKDINNMKILIPSEECLTKFESIVGLYFDRMAQIQKQVRFLEEARDRLLPKLMSGEIKV